MAGMSGPFFGGGRNESFASASNPGPEGARKKVALILSKPTCDLKVFQDRGFPCDGRVARRGDE